MLFFPRVGFADRRLGHKRRQCDTDLDRPQRRRDRDSAQRFDRRLGLLRRHHSPLERRRGDLHQRLQRGQQLCSMRRIHWYELMTNDAYPFMIINVIYTCEMRRSHPGVRRLWRQRAPLGRAHRRRGEPSASPQLSQVRGPQGTRRLHAAERTENRHR